MNFLQKFRKEKNLTQKQTADFLEISFYTYKNYELGLREIPINIFIKVLKEWKNYPARIKLLSVLKWYQNEINSTKIKGKDE